MSKEKQGCGLYRSFCLIFFPIIYIFSICVQAAPHRGDLFELKQPDGTRVIVNVWGDEYYQRVESVDGYSLIRNEYGWICYADLSDDGNEFIATEIVYDGMELNQIPAIKQYLQQSWGLNKRLKINPASRFEKVKKRKDELSKSKSLDKLSSPDEDSELTEAEPLLSYAPLSGSVVGLTILIDFPDEPATISVTEVDNYCNQIGYTGYSNNGSVRDYFYDVSNGILEYTNVVTNYYTAQNTKSYYDDCVDDKTTELILEALNWLEGQGFDFTQLSTDGNNRILALNIFYAGTPDCGWAKGLWPHASAYYGFTSGSGVKSGRYQITNLGSSLRLRTFCHENGHMICGYPDLYDYGYESHGVGDFGLMAAGGSNTNPVPPNPYLRDLKGWESIIEINSDAPGTIRNHLANSFTTYRYSHPTNPDEYFLIESRLKSGRNASLPDEGLLIWHIDESGSNNNEQMTPTEHYKVSVEQADGLFSLEGGTSYGGSGDLFHAGYKDSFNDTTLPDAKWWDGNNSALDISSISAVSSDMSFVVFAQESYPPTANDSQVTLTDPNEVLIGLGATDDGLPVSPGTLSYIITSLPEHGWLYDPNDGLEIIATPYTLQNDANSVKYKPCSYYFNGNDTFTFKANDGGIAPDGGDSNIADVDVVIDMLSDAVYEVDVNTKWDYIPFMTGFKKVRSQALYHADELGSKAQIFSNLALNIRQAPAIEIQNWTIRMKHTTLTEYPTTGAQFDNADWTVVYDANETISATGWHDFALQTEFAYDGVSNLLIDFSFDNSITSTGYGYVYDSATGTENRIISYWSNSGDPLLFQTPNVKWKRLFNIKLKMQPDTDMLYSDFNYNCSVGIEDMITMIDSWLAQEGDPAYNSACDISIEIDNKVNLADFAVLTSEWLYAIE